MVMHRSFFKGSRNFTLPQLMNLEATFLILLKEMAMNFRPEDTEEAFFRFKAVLDNYLSETWKDPVITDLEYTEEIEDVDD